MTSFTDPQAVSARTLAGVRQREAAASPQLHLFSIGLASRWCSACIPRISAPVETETPPHGWASRAAARREMIETAAYFLAQKRGFEPGHELEDWFAAENEIAHAQPPEAAWQP